MVQTGYDFFLVLQGCTAGGSISIPFSHATQCCSEGNTVSLRAALSAHEAEEATCGIYGPQKVFWKLLKDLWKVHPDLRKPLYMTGWGEAFPSEQYSDLPYVTAPGGHFHVLLGMEMGPRLPLLLLLVFTPMLNIFQHQYLSYVHISLSTLAIR